jgi:pimeloyl-ACP methyl ester carboxylesterase
MKSTSGFITANSREIYYEFHNLQFRSQNKPILVFLHEGLGSCAQWKDFPKEISDKTELPMLIYDRYGYGKSEMLNELRDNDYMDIEGFDSLTDLLKNLNITEKVILVGHSDGGTIALLFASKYPEKVLGVITEADHIFCEEITYRGFRATLKQFESGVLKRVL